VDPDRPGRFRVILDGDGGREVSVQLQNIGFDTTAAVA
jgi:hypothetical protein